MARKTLPPRLWEKNMTAIADGPMCEVRELTAQERQRFLAMVASGASLITAAQRIPVNFLVIGRMLANDPQFAADLEAAKQLRLMALEEVLLEQATVGVDKPVTYKGEITATHKELVTSNQTLQRYLAAYDPARWRERQEVTTRVEDPDKDIAPRITSQTDRERILEALARRSAERATPKEDDECDLL